MKLQNRTPLPAFAFRQFDEAGALDCVVALRATLNHVEGGTAAFRAKQEPFLWEDVYEGDPHTTPLLHQGDLVPGKPAADVTFLGATHAPGGPARAWSCRLQIGPVDRTLHVTGPRVWEPEHRRGLLRNRDERVVSGWRLGEPEPAAAVEMDWRRAVGGPIPGAVEQEGPPDVDPRNPIGCGIAGPREAWVDAPRPAPQILATAEAPAWDQALEPACFAPIPPFWKERQQHAGTYDDAWLEERHPLLPQDFHPRFWQCAPPGQTTDVPLAGTSYRLENLHPDRAIAEGLLPDITLAVHAAVGEAPGDWHLMALDGVQFDWRQDQRLYLTWRARFPLPEAEQVRLTLDRVNVVDPAEAGALDETAGETGDAA
ncbi:MAG: DUF2169 domain-containing protein [Pseudomonadota bacterium]